MLEGEVNKVDFSAVQVVGESGLGKSTVLDHLRKRLPNVLWLPSRCSARENVPFNAIDGMMGALVEHVVSDPAEKAHAEADLRHLARIFPGTEPLLDEPLDETAEEPPRLRALAFAAWARLLGSVAQRVPVVMAIDDAQWSDGDSRALIRELTETRPAHVTLLLASRVALPDLPATASLRLASLKRQDAVTLAANLLARPPDDPLVRSIASSSGGHPFFVSELARCGSEVAFALDDALWERVIEVGPHARGLIDHMSVAGQALPSAVLRTSLGLEPAHFERIARKLCVKRLARRQNRARKAYSPGTARPRAPGGGAPPRRCSAHSRASRFWLGR